MLQTQMKAGDPLKKRKNNMAGSSKQKKALAKKMAEYFTDKGYFVSPNEFEQDPNRPEMVKVATIKKIFVSWSQMVAFTKSFCWDEMRGLTTTKPVASAKPANPAPEMVKKAATAEKEGADGKNI